MPNPYQSHPKHVHEHETDGTAQSCFGCKRAAWDEGQKEANTQVRPLVIALEKVLHTIELCEANPDIGFSGFGLGRGGKLTLKAARAWLDDTKERRYP